MRITELLSDVFAKTEIYWIEDFGRVALTGERISFEYYSEDINKVFQIKAFSPEKYIFAVTFIDITDLKILEQSLIEEKELFKTTLFSVGDGVISTDTSGNVRIMNNIAEKLTGYTLSEAAGKPLSYIFNLVNVTTLEKIEDPIKQVLLTNEMIEIKDNVALVSKDKKLISVENNISPIRYKNNITKGIVLVFRDVTKEKEEMRKIEFLSCCDQLTSLYNRRFFEQSIDNLDKKENLPLSIIMIDVNGLKLANDAFGHSMGDRLLVEVSKILKSLFKKGQIVSRLGGDEFAILLPKTSSNKAKYFVDKIKELSDKSTLYPIKVSMALGWNTKNNIHENIESILKKSEDYMYKNKLLESQAVKSKTIETVIESLYQKNLIEEDHSYRVGCLCEAFARVLNLDKTEVEQLKMLGTLHDIGKIAVDNEILDKPRELSCYEFKEVKRHSEIGYNILSSVNDMSQIANYVLTHHENFDGTGYPKKLSGKDIPLPSRIIKIIDAYDAMTQDRPYRKALSRDKAICELKKYSGIQFDPELVKVFIRDVLREP